MADITLASDSLIAEVKFFVRYLVKSDLNKKPYERIIQSKLKQTWGDIEIFTFFNTSLYFLLQDFLVNSKKF